MTLHALLSATETTEDGAGLRASRLIAGQYLIERQAALCRDAGAEQLFVCVESMTDELITAFDRLRAAGIGIEPVRRASEIVDRTHPRDQLLLVLDGLYAKREQLAAFAAGASPSVFVTADTPVTRGLERIDADRRWAGFAVMRCDMLADLADLPEDWDLASTALRRVVQKGAARLPCDPALFERGDLIVVDSDIGATALSARVYDTATVGESGIVMANVLAPIARFAGPAALRRGVRSGPLEYAAMALFVLALAGWAKGWIVTGAGVAIVGLLTVAVARYVALFTLEPAPPRWRGKALAVLPLTVLGAFATRLFFGDSRGMAAFVSLALLALVQAQLMSENDEITRNERVLPDAGLIFAICGAAAAAGAIQPGVAVAALAGSALLAIGAWLARRGATPGFIPN